MPDFQYTARPLVGAPVNGVLSAATQQEAVANLVARQLFPVRVELAASSKLQEKQKSRRVAPKYLAVFYSQLGDLLKSGVPLLRSLELLERQSTQPALVGVIRDVKDQVANGTRLNDAMRQHPRAFTELMISMVRAGEEGGFLEDVLKRIAMFTEHQEDLKGRVLGALVYPIFLLITGAIVISVLLIWFIPKFKPIFDRQAESGDLPWATTTLLGFSESAGNYWLPISLLLAGAAYGLQTWLATENGRLQFDRFRLWCPGLSRIVRSLAISRFCRVLGTLLRNGVPILPSLRISKDATANRVLSEAINKATDNVSTGKSLAKPLSASGEFPMEIVEMIAVGEEANNLENVLIDISDNLERRTSRELEMLVRLLEPMLLLVMAGAVLFMVIAILLPILQSSTV